MFLEADVAIPTDRRGRILSLVVCLCVLAALVFLTLQLASSLSASASYWLDELYSVRLVDRGFLRMLIAAGGDVHPPLYYASLWSWTQIFGAQEAATRSLSLLSAAGTILVLLGLKQTLSRPTLMLLLFFTLFNPLLYFYALETRSYAFLAFLSALTMVCWIRGWIWTTILACGALGSTHYFGTLLALITLVLLILQRPTRSARMGALACAVAILIWPMLQLTITGVRDLTGGNFWIQTRGAEVFIDAIDATLPAVSGSIAGVLDQVSYRVSSAHWYIVVSVFCALLLAALLLGRTKDPEGKIAAETALVVSILVVAVFLIGFHTPLATTRNFIVIVPQVALITAILCNRFSNGSTLRSGVLTVVLIGFAILSTLQIREELAEKMAPVENWRKMADVALTAAQDREIELGVVVANNWIDGAYEWYLPNDTELQRYSVSADWAAIAPSAILFYDLHCGRGDRVRAGLLASGRPFEEIEMSQSKFCGDNSAKNAVFLVGVE